MGSRHRVRLKVRHHEIDVYGHVNHAHYVHYLETGRIEALDAIGLSIDEMKRQGYSIFAVDLFVKYVSPARLGEELDVLTHVRDGRGVRSIWVQEIREAQGGRLVATGVVTAAFMSANGRPARIPTHFADKLAALHVEDDGGSADGA